MKKILLTGGNGFIGKNIRESFLAERYDIEAPSSKELDLADTDSVDTFFRNRNFDAVIHAAAKPGHRNAADQNGIFYTNSRMFFHLVRHADRFGRLINIGSGCIYDMRHYRSMMPESYFGEHVPADETGLTKYVCGKYMEICSEDVVDLRVFGIFGKYEDYAIRFISNAICKTLFDLPVTLRQDRRFSYLFVEDLMPVLAWFIENKPKFRAYNVTPDTENSLLDLARMVIEISGKSLPVRVGTPGEGIPYSGDNGRLKAEMQEIGHEKLYFRPIRESVEALYGWYVSGKAELDKDCLLYDK